MQEINELTQHEEILTKKGKNIAQEVLSQALHKNRSKEPPVSQLEDHDETVDRQQTETQSPAHVSPSVYLQTPQNSPLNSPEKVQEKVVQDKAQEQESQKLEALGTGPVVTQTQQQEMQEIPGKEVTEVVPSGKSVLIIPSGEEEERPKMAMIFRRVRAQELSAEKDKEKTEEEMIDQMHE